MACKAKGNIKFVGIYFCWPKHARKLAHVSHFLIFNGRVSSQDLGDEKLPTSFCYTCWVWQFGTFLAFAIKQEVPIITIYIVKSVQKFSHIMRVPLWHVQFDFFCEGCQITVRVNECLLYILQMKCLPVKKPTAMLTLQNWIGRDESCKWWEQCLIFSRSLLHAMLLYIQQCSRDTHHII